MPPRVNTLFQFVDTCVPADCSPGVWPLIEVLRSCDLDFAPGELREELDFGKLLDDIDACSTRARWMRILERLGPTDEARVAYGRLWDDFLRWRLRCL